MENVAKTIFNAGNIILYHYTQACAGSCTSAASLGRWCPPIVIENAVEMDWGMKSADDIALALLHQSAGPLISGDFETFAACFHLPQAVATPSQLRILRTRGDLRELFQDLIEYYRSNGTGMVNRRLIKAEFMGEASVISVHENILIGNKGVIASPLRQTSVLQRKTGCWRVGFCEYTPADDLDFCRVMVGVTDTMAQSLEFTT